MKKSTNVLSRIVVCLFYKSLLPFLTFVNWECPYLAKGLLRNVCPCFDIVFAQVRVIPRTRNKFVETVTVAQRHLIIAHVENKEWKKQLVRICLPVKLADKRMSIKKEKTSSNLIYSIVKLVRMVGKTKDVI